jgi:hypothetical protein
VVGEEGQGEMTPEQTVRRIGRRFIRWWTPLRIAGAAALVLAFLIGIVGYLNERELLYPTETVKQLLKYLSANVSTELASVAITLLFVDCLYQRREEEREKRRLILQMGSPDNAFAVEAIRALRSHGWLEDGSLKRAYLMGANLQGANLLDANLQGANLALAKLQGASLTFANLQGANLALTKLQGAYLGGARLQGADLQSAKLQGTKYDNATTWPAGFTPPPEAINVDTEANVEDRE